MRCEAERTGAKTLEGAWAREGWLAAQWALGVRVDGVHDSFGDGRAECVVCAGRTLCVFNIVGICRSSIVQLVLAINAIIGRSAAVPRRVRAASDTCWEDAHGAATPLIARWGRASCRFPGNRVRPPEGGAPVPVAYHRIIFMH